MAAPNGSPTNAVTKAEHSAVAAVENTLFVKPFQYVQYGDIWWYTQLSVKHYCLLWT